MSDLGHPVAAFGLGVALATSPGPVQLLLLSEASRGGVRRGLRAMAGANGTFGVFLVALALGLSSFELGGTFLRIVRVVGGLFLLLLAVDALRERRRRLGDVTGPSIHPTVRGVVAVLVNPGAYVFLATTATALLATATADGGRSLAVLTAGALLAGVSVTDAGMVVLGAGAHRVGERAVRVLGDVLALGLGALGIWLVVQGFGG